MGKRQRNKVLAIVATDSSFELAEVAGREVWVGKCLHCGSRLIVGLDGAPISQATVEHILPRHHGGTDELENLGLACARCNALKGIHHDNQRAEEPRAREVIEQLLARRRARWRDPSR